MRLLFVFLVSVCEDPQPGPVSPARAERRGSPAPLSPASPLRPRPLARKHSLFSSVLPIDQQYALYLLEGILNSDS